MRSFFKPIVFISIIPLLLIGLFFFDNIKGYYRFKIYCENEGGLRVYAPLEKNMGWWAKDKYDAEVVSQLKYVDFVRYTEKKDGKTYDLHYLGGNPNKNSSYQVELADFSKGVKYKWLSIYERIENESRLDKFGQKIVGVNDDEVFVTSYSLKYEFFNRDHMILDMAHKEYCPSMGTEKFIEPNSWINKFNAVFSK